MTISLTSPSPTPDPTGSPATAQDGSDPKPHTVHDAVAALDQAPADTETGTGRGHSRAARAAMGFLLTLVAIAVTVMLLAPVVLSSRDLLAWGASPLGLGLPGRWPALVILTLDAPAIACVLMSVICTWRGERPGIFGALIWAFALASAFANFRHTHTGTAPDATWFIPSTSLIGPGLLDVVLHRVRSWMRPEHHRSTDSATATGRTASWSWQAWMPGLGSLRDSFGTYRTRILLHLDSLTDATDAFHDLCPDGSLRVGSALRRRYLAQAQARTLIALASQPPHENHDDDSDDENNGDNPAAGDEPDRGWPTDMMRRIPVRAAAYRGWYDAWNDLKTIDAQAGPARKRNLAALAEKHHVSVRQIHFINRAGELGLLDSPIPTAVRLARTALERAAHTPDRAGAPQPVSSHPGDQDEHTTPATTPQS
jgi:hypothetical protein